MICERATTRCSPESIVWQGPFGAARAHLSTENRTGPSNPHLPSRRIMRASTMGTVLAAAALAGTCGVSSYGQGGSQETTNLIRTTRGGLLATTAQRQFEVFFYRTGVRVFPQTKDGQPVDISRTVGTATFYHPNSPSPWFSRPLRASPGQPGSLDLVIGLANAPASGAKVAFDVSGISGTSEPRATFTVPLEFVAEPAAPRGGVAAVPGYTYGLGYDGYGYYPDSRSAASPGARSYRSYGDSVGPGHRDWSSGRDS